MDKILLIKLNIHFIRYGNNAAVVLGCLNPDKRAQCLREKSVHDILSVPSPPDRPSVDSSRASPYLPHNPLDLSTSGEYLTDIDVMLGFTEDDGMLITQFLLAYPTLYNVLKSLWRFLGPYLLFQQTQISHTSEEDIAVATEILKFYTDNGQVADLGPDNFQNITDMLTDSYFAFANHLFLKHHLQHSTATTYQYRFSYYVSFQTLCKYIIFRRCSNPKFSNK